METKITKQFKEKSKTQTINENGEIVPVVYEITLKFLLESKQIYFIDCTCGDFVNRQLKEQGILADKKVYAEPCKHLKKLTDFYEREYGFTIKRPKQMEGTNNCTAGLRKALLKRSGGLCENNCGKSGVCVHRKIRGSNGGKYNEENCVLLCVECHKFIHGNEFRGSKGK